MVYKGGLESIYTPLVAREYFSTLFRQRGVLRVDMFTYDIIGSFGASLGHGGEVEDTLRRILTLGRWSNLNTSVTIGTIAGVMQTCDEQTVRVSNDP